MATNGNSQGKLTPRQRRAIAALLSERDIKAAAEAAKVGYRTLLRWLDDPDFRAALVQAERDLVDGTTRRLVAGQDKALDVLDNVMDGLKDTDRRQAAQAWLDYTLKYKDLDIEARVIALEKAVNNGKLG